MTSIYKTLNKVQSHLITWGAPFGKGSDVIVCISGNPGITDFYTEFAAELHENTKLPVCMIGQAGHEEVPDRQSNVTLKGQEHLFDLEGQIQHKLDLIINHIDKDCKLHLIGHSIGSWLILALLQKNKSIISRVSSINMLFPTIQHIAESGNGKFFNNIIRRLHAFILVLFAILNIIPVSLKNRVIEFYLNWNSLPLSYSERLLKFCSPLVVEKVLFLAYDEMDNVRMLNREILDIVKDMTNVLYTSKDGWAPVKYIDDLRQFEPQMKIKEVNAEHAFVLKSSQEVGEMVSEFVKGKM